MAVPYFDGASPSTVPPEWLTQDAQWPPEFFPNWWVLVPVPESTTASCVNSFSEAVPSKKPPQQFACPRDVGGWLSMEEPSDEFLTSLLQFGIGEARCAALSAQLETGGAHRDAALAELQGNVVLFSFDAVACRVVQLAISVASWDVAISLVGELRGHIRDCIESPAANYVIQKIIEVMQESAFELVCQELEGLGVETACQRFGCRVLCRLLEHVTEEVSLGATKRLLSEVVDSAVPLCFHTFGHHVIESAIEHGNVQQQHSIALALQGDMLHICTHQYGSFVVCKAMQYLPPNDQQSIASAIVSPPENVHVMAFDACGVYVVRALLRMPEHAIAEALRTVKCALLSHPKCKVTRRVAQALQSRCLAPLQALAPRSR